MTWLAHWSGLDDGAGAWYLWWSGICGDLVFLGAFAALIRHLNCHVDGCKRFGPHHVAGTSFRVCRRHHPDGGNNAAQITAAYHRTLR